MNCPNCGALIQHDSKYCHKCGSAIALQETTPTGHTSNKSKPNSVIKTLWVVVFGILLIGTYAALFIPAATGNIDYFNKQAGSAGIGSTLWTSLIFWRYTKNNGGNGKRAAWIGAGIGLLAFLIASFLAGFVHAEKRHSEESLSQQVQDMAAQINEDRAKYSSNQIRLDSAISGSNNTVIVKMTALGRASNDIDPTSFNKNAEDLFGKALCKNDDDKAFLNAGAKIRYELYGSDGGFVGEVTIADADCKVVSPK